MFQPPEDFDPYRDLVELKNFATSADTHLGNLLKNEKEICIAINQLSDNIKQIKQRITLMEKVLQELANEKRS